MQETISVLFKRDHATMPTLAQKPATTPIPVQLSATEFHQFILPHLSMPKRGPKCKLGYHGVFNLILWVLYTGMQWKCSHSIDFSGNALSPSQLSCDFNALPCEVKIFMRPCGESTSGAPRAALGIRLGHPPHLPHEGPGMGEHCPCLGADVLPDHARRTRPAPEAANVHQTA
jgi:hypothetical protein